MSIYKIDTQLSISNKVSQLNDMIIELNGRLAQAVFTELDVTDLYSRTLDTRKYLRSQDIGNTVSTYTNWSHFNAQTGYSIWKFSPTNYLYDSNNAIYMNNKVIDFKGLANSESATTFDSVFWLNEESGNTYHDYTSTAAIEGGSGFPVMDTIYDYLYLGLDATFSGAKFEWQTRGSNYTLVVEYWDGDSWETLTSLSDDLVDDTNNFMSDGHISWTAPGDWALRTINGQNKYWIRISTSTTPVTVGQCNYLIPSNSVIGLLALSSTDIQNEKWAWCSYGSSIYVTIRNTGNSSYEGSYFITSSSSSNNLQNFFVVNNPFTGDYADNTYSATDFSAVWGLVGGTLSDQTDLQAALDAKLTDAPSDGSTYVRKDATWVTISFAVNWGSITGTLSSQTDLQNALDNKSSLDHVHTLDDLSNVGVTSGLSNGQILTYDSSKGWWINWSPNFATSVEVQNLSHSKYDASNPAHYQTLTNVTTLLADYALVNHTHTLDSLSDVAVFSGLSTGQVLTWNAEVGVWHNADSSSGSASVTTETFDNGDLTTGIFTISGEHTVLQVRDNNTYMILPDEIYFSDGNTKIDIVSQGTISGTWEVDYI